MRGIKAYNGRYIAYRAWYNGHLIWDYGVDAIGDLVSVLNTVAKPETDTPACVALSADITGIEVGAAATWELEPIQTYADATVSGNADPHVVEAKKTAAQMESDLQVLCAPATFGMVFTNGVVKTDFLALAMPRTAEAKNTTGTSESVMTGALLPKSETILSILASAEGEQHGSAAPKHQDVENTFMCSASSLEASTGAYILPVYTVTFMSNGEIVRQEKVIHGYACPDPVITGVTDKPTKEMTVSHAYTYSHWGLDDSSDFGASDINSQTTILSEDIYDGFTYGFAYNPGTEIYIKEQPDWFHLTIGETYRILWDGQEFFGKAYSCVFRGIELVAIGNEALINGESSIFTEPFVIACSEQTGYSTIATISSNTSHTVSISRVDILNDDSLSRITDNMVFYAKFFKSIRYYTAQFIVDDDVYDIQQVAYGNAATPPDVTREGYTTQWVPDNFVITGDTNFEAVFVEKVVYSGENIAFAYDKANQLYCATVTAEETLQVGATYTVEWDGEIYTCRCRTITYTTNNQYIPTVSSTGIGDCTINKLAFTSLQLSTTESSTGEPFWIMTGSTKNFILATESNKATHTVKIT